MLQDTRAEGLHSGPQANQQLVMTTAREVKHALYHYSMMKPPACAFLQCKKAEMSEEARSAGGNFICGDHPCPAPLPPIRSLPAIPPAPANPLPISCAQKASRVGKDVPDPHHPAPCALWSPPTRPLFQWASAHQGSQMDSPGPRAYDPEDVRPRVQQDLGHGQRHTRTEMHRHLATVVDSVDGGAQFAEPLRDLWAMGKAMQWKGRQTEATPSIRESRATVQYLQSTNFCVGQARATLHSCERPLHRSVCHPPPPPQQRVSAPPNSMCQPSPLGVTDTCT